MPDRQNLGRSGKLFFFVIYKFWQICPSVWQFSDLILKTESDWSILDIDVLGQDCGNSSVKHIAESDSWSILCEIPLRWMSRGYCWYQVNIGSGDGLVQSGTKPLPEPIIILTPFYKPVWHWSQGPWFNIKMTSYQHKKSDCGDKTTSWPCYLHNGISYTGKMTSLCGLGHETAAALFFVFLLSIDSKTR